MHVGERHLAQLPPSSQAAVAQELPQHAAPLVFRGMEIARVQMLP